MSRRQTLTPNCIKWDTGHRIALEYARNNTHIILLCGHTDIEIPIASSTRGMFLNNSLDGSRGTWQERLLYTTQKLSLYDAVVSKDQNCSTGLITNTTWNCAKSETMVQNDWPRSSFWSSSAQWSVTRAFRIVFHTLLAQNKERTTIFLVIFATRQFHGLLTVMETAFDRWTRVSTVKQTCLSLTISIWMLAQMAVDVLWFKEKLNAGVMEKQGMSVDCRTPDVRALTAFQLTWKWYYKIWWAKK